MTTLEWTEPQPRGWPATREQLRAALRAAAAGLLVVLTSLAGGAGAAWRAVCAALGVFDWIAAVGVVMLFVGLLIWFGAGVAFTAVGGLLLVLGIAGGRAAAAAAANAASARGG